MSDNKPTNVARLPQQQPAKFEIDFPTLLMMSVEKGLDPQVIVTMFQGEIARRQKEALDTVKAQIYGEMLPVLKDGHNKHLGNRYTTIPAMMEMLQPILHSYGVFVGFDVGVLPGEPAVADGHVRVRIVISYAGYSDSSSYIDEPISRGGVRGGVTQMNDQQAITSATTYGARTLLKLKFNILGVDDDDDGETASPKTTPNNTAAAPKPADVPDAATLFPSVAKNLARAITVENVDTLARNEKVVAFRAQQTPNNQAVIDRMFADRRAELTPAASADLPDDLDLEDKETTTASGDVAGALIGQVQVCHTPQEITAVITAPSFTKAMADLFPPDAEKVTAAIKAHEAKVGGGTA